MSPRRLALPCLLLALASPLAAFEGTARTYAVPGRPALRFQIPVRWKENIEWSSPPDVRPTIHFAPSGEQVFSMTVALEPVPPGLPDYNHEENVQRMVVEGAKGYLPVGDRGLNLQELVGNDGKGYLYSVTDSSVPDPAPPGTWRCLTQGAMAAGSYLLKVTILTQSPTAPDLAEAIEVVRGVHVTTDAPDAWRVPGAALSGPDAKPGRYFTINVPDGFEQEDFSPMVIRHSDTGAALTISVEARTSDWKSEVRRVAEQRELMSPGTWRLVRKGGLLVDGHAGGEISLDDEMRDVHVHDIVVASGARVVTLHWEVPLTKAREAEPARKALLATFHLVEPAHS